MVTLAFPNWLAITALVYLIGIGLFFLLFLVLGGIVLVGDWRDPSMTVKAKLLLTVDLIRSSFGQGVVWPVIVVALIIGLILNPKLPF